MIASRLLLLVACLAEAGCISVGYLGQAASGHFALLQARRPLEAVIADPATAPEVRAKLALARAARTWAIEALALPDNGSYTHYVALARRYVVWNVFAAPEFGFALRQSCFPLIGCLAYRGYFSEADARAAGQSLRGQGLDVYVGGIAAYSTLGWFADPLVSSMLRWDGATLARTLFHELAHQRVYVADDTAFNESYATAVASAGYARWRQTPAARETDATADGTLLPAEDDAFVALLLDARAELSRLYAQRLAPDLLRARKHAAFAKLRARFAAQAAGWQQRDAYARWLERDLNNAKLASVATYHDHVPAFLALLRHQAGNFADFHATVAALAAQPRARRDACLRALRAPPAAWPAACPQLPARP